MAQVSVPITTITRTGTDPDAGGTVLTHATDGFLFPNDGKTFLHIVNANVGSAVVVTFQTPQTIAGLAVAELTLSVPLSSRRIVGAFPRETFNVQSGTNLGDVSCTTDGNGTDITVHAYRL